MEGAFRNLKGDLQIRPIFHWQANRIEAHICVAYLAYCLQMTLPGKLRVVLGEFATMQMIGVHFPTDQPDKELTCAKTVCPRP